MVIGIVGLPFSGKSTLFQTITKAHQDGSSSGKRASQQAIIKVPDKRLEALIEIFSPQKSNYATIELIDVVGLQRGDSGGTQFTTNFLSNVKTTDALVQVVRVFENDAVPHPEGNIDPLRDISIIETEFILSDMAILEARIERIKKQFQKNSTDEQKRELPVLEKCIQYLHDEKPLREAELTKSEIHILKSYSLLTVKPMLIVLNLDEKQLSSSNIILKSVQENKSGKNTDVVSFSGKIEMELTLLEDEETKNFMHEYGIRESALDVIVREAYSLLGLHSFFTVGEDECRAWTIRKEMSAQEAAGAIHSDFFDKFIRAEVVGYQDFIDNEGSFSKVKEKGLWRLEGKEYIVNDGDIISIRHS
ncbi:MAG: redox-regulated ATPase YchF [Ignavibacteriales bacterium]|nr:redox-regulated ATPase YchF [Ignavibacteriales bacterium]